MLGQTADVLKSVWLYPSTIDWLVLPRSSEIKVSDVNLRPKNCSANTLTTCRGRRGLESLSYHLSTVSSPSNGRPAVQSTPLEGRSFSPRPERLVVSEDLSARRRQSPTAPSADETGYGTETPYHPFNEHFSHHNEDETGTLQTQGDVIDTCYSPLYGDPRGVGLVVDICEPEPREKSGHFLVPRINQTYMDQETIDYLRHKGVFDFPTSSVCEMIIRTYFYYVHPFFPVVDARSFLEKFENARNEALYDAEYERKKITLIQAVLLTGFWYSDTEDRTGPWHWNGVAIGLCQTIGLHRQPDTGQRHSKAISMNDSRIWRQLWWSCFYRETWFSAGMGRPMRINLADCSTPIPDAEDSDNLLAGIPESTQKKYLPEDTEDLSKLWAELLALTVCLAKILSWQNRAERTRPSRTEIQHMDDSIRECYSHKDHTIAQRQSYVVSLHRFHLELYLESAMLILYRPFLFDKPEINSPGLSVDEWTSTVLRRTKDAAMNTNKILGSMIAADMISNTQAMVCIALVPTLQIHLLDATSDKQLLQRLGRHNLEFCMLIIEELKSVYFGAEILSRMFNKAKSRIYNKTFAPTTAPRDYVPQSSQSSHDATIDSIPNVADGACQDDTEIFDAFSTILGAFPPVTADGFFFNDELSTFEPDITFGQPMFPEPESSADTR
ncbi:hypothetical protein AN1077.2 [Aspergillus nidulans FGSC A4]|nr:hypothetical protein AN1077.2 [Aspergillus nidulans FGSC A4]|eukprot:XP_658681.1 hypothetical protein AN1077.2 [Aspergillus nidulans FGSC A4]